MRGYWQLLQKAGKNHTLRPVDVECWDLGRARKSCIRTLIVYSRRIQIRLTEEVVIAYAGVCLKHDSSRLRDADYMSRV